MSKKIANLNDLAVKVAKYEKGKKEISIGQIKEVMKILFILLAKMGEKKSLSIINRYKNRRLK